MSVAYHAVLAGAEVVLIDRRDPGRATDAGAGILAPESNWHDAEEWFPLGMAACDYYPELVRLLAADDAGDPGYAPCEQLIVAIGEDEVALLNEAKRVVFARQERRGAPEADALRTALSGETRRRFPPLAETRGAIYCRNAGRVDGRLMAAAMERGAVGRGLTVRTASVEQLLHEGNRVVGVETEGESIRGGAVVIAGGAWSPRFGTQLGVKIPIEPQRGQIVHLDLRGEDTAGWPIINAFRGHYLVPWEDGRVVAGATREDGSGFEPVTTAEGVREVLSEALQLAPGLRDAAIREIRVGLRPVTPDKMPVLGRVPGREGVYLATGHGATGLQLGPYSGKRVAEMALGKDATEVDLAPYRLARFLA